MQKYHSIEEIRAATNDLTTAQIIDALYSRSRESTTFGDAFAADPVNGIVSTRLTLSFSQEVVRLLMSCVRADAEKRGDEVPAAIDAAASIILSAVEEAKQTRGLYP